MPFLPPNQQRQSTEVICYLLTYLRLVGLCGGSGAASGCRHCSSLSSLTFVSAEPAARCDATVCMNGGVCVQQWNAVECDCDMTSFTGPHCDHGLTPPSPTTAASVRKYIG